LREVALSVFWPLVAIHLFLSAALMYRFFRFCEQVAKHREVKAEGREFWTKSNHSGISPFQTAQYKLIVSGQYRELQDPKLVQTGESLSWQFKVAKFATVALICCLAVIDIILK
jgi:hypothetical protein